MLSESEDSSDSSESEDEEQFVIAYIAAARYRNSRVSIENFVENVVPMYSEREFITQFRIRRNLQNQFEQHEIYRNLLVNPGGRRPLSPEKHILAFLYFVGHEAVGYRAVNNIFNMALNALYSAVNRVAQFICSLGPHVIKWPQAGELQEVKAYFNYHKKIPDIIGLIDGSHVQIDKPLNDPDSYINRKGHYSIQLQGIVNHKKKDD